jgi:hypothetical protein
LRISERELGTLRDDHFWCGAFCKMADPAQAAAINSSSCTAMLGFQTRVRMAKAFNLYALFRKRRRWRGGAGSLLLPRQREETFYPQLLEVMS